MSYESDIVNRVVSQLHCYPNIKEALSKMQREFPDVYDLMLRRCAIDVRAEVGRDAPKEVTCPFCEDPAHVGRFGDCDACNLIWRL